MKFLGELLELMSLDMPVPTAFGWFHLLFFVLSIALGVWLCIQFRNPSQRTVRIILLVLSLVVLVLEAYKQIQFNFHYDGSAITFDYQWYAFPYQFCSTPMYVGLLAAIIGYKPIHRSLCAFLATYALFAGLCVMFYPADVFISTIGINIQTMVCHGTMLSISIFLFGSGYVKAEHKTMLRALPVFSGAVLIAVILNEVFYYSGILNGETCNLFFVSRHFAPSLPVYSLVQAAVPYPWCLIIYILGFTAASYILLLIVMGIKAIVKKCSKRKIAVS